MKHNKVQINQMQANQQGAERKCVGLKWTGRLTERHWVQNRVATTCCKGGTVPIGRAGRRHRALMEADQRSVEIELCYNGWADIDGRK